MKERKPTAKNVDRGSFGMQRIQPVTFSYMKHSRRPIIRVPGSQAGAGNEVDCL